jgi:hypothetical protein
MASNSTQRATAPVAGRSIVAIRVVLRMIVAAGLITDAWVHFDLAPTYDVVRAQLSEGTLFRLEAVVAAVAALLVLAVPHRITLIIGFVVAASAVAALLLSTYADPGQIGPLPDMYEPTWFNEKRLALVAEPVAAVAALAGLAWETFVRRRQSTMDF